MKKIIVFALAIILLYSAETIAENKVVVIPLIGETTNNTSAIWHGFCTQNISMGSTPQTYCLYATGSPNLNQSNGYFTVNKNYNNKIEIIKKGLYQIIFSAMDSYMCHIYLYRNDVLVQRSGAGPFTSDTMAIASGSINYILDGWPGDSISFKIHTGPNSSYDHFSNVGMYSAVTIIKIQ